MTFIETATEGTAAGTVDQLYAADVDDQGYVANYTRVFALRPEVLAGWAQLNGAIKHGMDLRRYELVTLAAARALRSTYCAMAHGRLLRDRFYDPEAVRRIATDHARAGLTPAEVAVMDFADQVARDRSRRYRAAARPRAVRHRRPRRGPRRRGPVLLQHGARRDGRPG
jgi:AhpD family alkylhydroperoxidase